MLIFITTKWKLCVSRKLIFYSFQTPLRVGIIYRRCLKCLLLNTISLKCETFTSAFKGRLYVCMILEFNLRDRVNSRKFYLEQGKFPPSSSLDFPFTGKGYSYFTIREMGRLFNIVLCVEREIGWIIAGLGQCYPGSSCNFHIFPNHCSISAHPPLFSCECNGHLSTLPAWICLLLFIHKKFFFFIPIQKLLIEQLGIHTVHIVSRNYN